jgi:hypothetical protein
MVTAHLGQNTPSLDAARRHRAELLDSVHQLERALGAPMAGPDWRPRVHRQLIELRDAFAGHMVVTEGPEGLYAELLWHAPRLDYGVRKLVREHEVLMRHLDTLCARAADTDPRRLRTWSGDILRELARHRQRGADLVYEAYHTDIGGET